MHPVRGGGSTMPLGNFFDVPPSPSKKKRASIGDADKDTLERKGSTASTTGRKSSISSISSNSSSKKSDKRKSQEKGLYHMLQQEKEHHQHHQQEAPPQPLQHRVRKRDRVRAFFTSSSSSSSSPIPHSPHPHSAPLSSTFTLSTVLMASEHDIYLKWPYPVPHGVQVYIAGTFKVPGHGPWEKLPMSFSELNHCWEVHLDVQEVEHHQHLPEDDHPAASVDDDHSTHSNHSTHSSQSTQDDPSKAATTTTPRESRTSRFFGRAKSSDKKEAPAAAAAPYRHEPLRKTYSYLYKFIIGDDWQCDPHAPQVWDDNGHLNNELTVELVEQGPVLAPIAPSLPLTTSSAETTKPRSRTPSIHSIQSVQLPTVDEDKPLSAEAPMPSAQQKEEEEQPPQPPAANVSQTLPESSSTTGSVADTASNNVRVRDIYVPVMVIDEHDEHDEKSDGEGRSKAITDNDILSDDESAPQQLDEPQHATKEEQVTRNAADAVAPPLAASETVPHTEPLGAQDKKKETQEGELAQHVEPHPQDGPQDELHTNAPAAPIVVDEKDASSLRSFAAVAANAAVASTVIPNHASHDSTNEDNHDDKNKESYASIAATDAAPHLSKEPEALPASSPPTSFAAAVAQPTEASTLPRRRSYADFAAQPPKEFMLQEAAELRSDIPTRSSTAPPQAAPRHSEESTDSKEHDTTVSRTYYALSPPLTPPMSMRTLEDLPSSCSSSYSSHDEEEDEQEDTQETPMTPQSVKHSSPRAMGLTHSKETSESSQYSSKQVEEETEKDQRSDSREVLNPRDGFDDKAPVRLPSLVWSLTKTTAVLSTAVVLIAFGFGRKKE